MDGSSLRKKGPIGASGSEDNPGVKQEDTPLFNTRATPHPDNQSGTNQQTKTTYGKPPLGGLGSRGHAGAD